MPYTKEQLKGARRSIQKSLTGCYKGEFRLGLLLKTEECAVALTMSQESGAQIMAGEIKGNYQYFAPKQDTFTYLGFKWNRN
jgi:hypothetical protein